MVEEKFEKKLKKKEKEILQKNPKAIIDYGILLKNMLKEVE